MNKQIGRYEVQEELGRGAMAVVYKAADPLIGRIVAIKTIRLEQGTGMEQEELQQRLYREAQSAGSLNHPSIVTIYDIGQEGDLAYIAMEFIEGETLEAWMENQTIPPIEQTLSIIEQVAAGLDFAAERGIIHRDIKPGNILLDSDLTAKIADFGIAKFSMSKFTQTGMVMGTPSYMSPEQAMGKELDGKSDIFSLGIIFYELLTGERPFSGTNPTTIIYKILHEEPVPPRKLNVTLHEGLEYIVQRMLAKDPGERYQTCGEFMRDLKDYTALGSKEEAAVEAPPVQEHRRSALPLWITLVVIALGAIGYVVYRQIGSQVEPVQPQVAGTEVESQPPAAPVEPSADPEPAPADVQADPPSEVQESSAAADKPGESPSTPTSDDVDAASAPPVVEAPPEPEEPPPPPAPAEVRMVYDGTAYDVSLYDGRRKLQDLSSGTASISVPAGAHRFRLVNEEVFLNKPLRVTLKPEQVYSIRVPGLASAYIEVPNDAYEGCELLLDGIQLPTPYPAQIQELAAGDHELTFRWTSGKYIGKEFKSTITSEAGGHYLIQGKPESEEATVQRVR
jgi:serine/threonine protein kinase